MRKGSGRSGGKPLLYPRGGSIPGIGGTIAKPCRRSRYRTVPGSSPFPSKRSPQRSITRIYPERSGEMRRGVGDDAPDALTGPQKRDQSLSRLAGKALALAGRQNRVADLTDAKCSGGQPVGAVQPIHRPNRPSAASAERAASGVMGIRSRRAVASSSMWIADIGVFWHSVRVSGQLAYHRMVWPHFRRLNFGSALR